MFFRRNSGLVRLDQSTTLLDLGDRLTMTGADALWVALRAAERSGEPVQVRVPAGDGDGAQWWDDLGVCRVLRYERRPRPGTVFEIATVQPEGTAELRVVHRLVRTP